MVEIVGRDQEELNELQADVTGYELAEITWGSRNESQSSLWFLRCPRLKILI